MRILPLPLSGGLIFSVTFWSTFAAWILPELFAWGFKRSPDISKARDHGSLGFIAVLWSAGIAMDFGFSLLLPEAALSWMRTPLFFVGVCAILLGITLRWYSAGVLGKYFTFDVAIQNGQPLIELGPYKYIRHPSYSGALLSLFGFGLALGNWAGAIAGLSSLGIAYAYRIPIEEAALRLSLGDAYNEYVKRTWRLVPYIY
jgi:protein-S-isoprenylcysteine O-methyltransferase Ste14